MKEETPIDFDYEIEESIEEAFKIKKKSNDL
jgi:hypothetical protein